MSLLRDIQADLATPGGDLTSVLLKCKILAARLGSDEFAQWIQWELNGYPDEQPVPDYRRLPSHCYANFLNIAWRADNQHVPWQLLPEDMRDSVRYQDFRGSVAKIHAFVTDGARIHRPDVIRKVQGKMFPGMNCVAAWCEISGTEFDQLVSRVKNRILDFVLKIEAENPNAGDAVLNSQPVAPEKLHTLVNNFFGSIGNLAQNSQNVGQTAHMVNISDLERLVSELTKHLHELNLDDVQERKATAQIATLKAQLDDEPDPVIVRQAAQTLRNLTEGTISSLLATAVQPTVWQWISQILVMLSS